jgi:HicB family
MMSIYMASFMLSTSLVMLFGSCYFVPINDGSEIISMARKPADIVQPSLRIRDDLHRRLEQAAKKRGVSLNSEMTIRLKESFDREALRTIDGVASDLGNAWMRFAEMLQDETLQEELMRAGESLVEQLPADIREREAIKGAVERVRKATTAIARRIGRARDEE